MPTYSFTDTKTGQTWTELMSISEKEEFLATNPHITQDVCAPAIVDPWHVGRTKVPSDFNDGVLKRIKKNNRKANIDTGNITQI